MKEKKIKIFLLSAAVTGLLSLTSCQTSKPVSASKNLFYTDDVQVKQGFIRGTFNEDKSVEIFTGVPYAAPPVGELRWREPQDLSSWDGVRDCTDFAPMAEQKRSSPLYTYLYNLIGRHNPKGDREDNAPMSEDCLYLNIWKPAGEVENLPVLVFIHGGSLVSGSTLYESYDGEAMAKKGIIFVSIAYRVGIFGYLADGELAAESPNNTTGNYGLLDQIKALQWIHENISSFGGNPSLVTVAGESAGSSSVSAICVSPLAKGLFRYAIGESSSVVIPEPPHTFRSMDKALQMGEDIKKEFKVSSIKELRKMDAAKLIKTKYQNSAMTVDGYAITEYPWETYRKGKNNEEALLNGFNKEEAYAFTLFAGVKKSNYTSFLEKTFGTFTPRLEELYPADKKHKAVDQYNEIFTSFNFSYPHHMWSTIASSNDKAVWEYYFTKTNGGITDYHSGEMIYCYGNVPVNNKHYDESDYKTEAIMQSYWINFAKTGNPNGEGLPLWQKFDPSASNVLEIGSSTGMTQDPYLEVYKIYKEYQDQKVSERQKQ